MILWEHLIVGGVIGVNFMRYRESKNTNRTSHTSNKHKVIGEKVVKVNKGHADFNVNRTYISVNKKNIPNRTNALNELTKNWILKNSKKGGGRLPNLEINNYNMSHFLRFVKMVKSRKLIHEKIKQVMNTYYLDWYAKSLKIELIIQTDKTLVNEYNKMKNMYIEGNNSCKQDLNSCSVITSIISLI